jgi:hypothetical protein
MIMPCLATRVEKSDLAFRHRIKGTCAGELVIVAALAGEREIF